MRLILKYTPSSAQLHFITQHLGPGEAPPHMLEKLVGELQLLPEYKWPAHLAALGGSYTLERVSPFRKIETSVGVRRPSQLKATDPLICSL